MSYSAAWAYMLLGQLSEGAQAARDSLREAQRHGVVAAQSWSYLVSAFLAIQAGDWEESKRAKPKKRHRSSSPSAQTPSRATRCQRSRLHVEPGIGVDPVPDGVIPSETQIDLRCRRKMPPEARNSARAGQKTNGFAPCTGAPGSAPTIARHDGDTLSTAR